MPDVKWDAEADLVVIGFGAAGATASITAADAGSQVIVLEKQPAAWHTPSTRASGGQFMCVTDADRATPYLVRCGGPTIPAAVSRAWAEAAESLADWVTNVVELEVLRLIHAEHPAWEGADVVSGWGAREAYPAGERTQALGMTVEGKKELGVRPGGGAVLFAALEKAVKKRDRITVLYQTRASRLIQGESGRVIGVEATSAQGSRRVHGRKGVVLTCGGYEWDETMKASYLPVYPAHFYGTPANTGDGVRMAQAIGADLWHMNAMAGRAIAHVELDGQGYNFVVSVAPGGYVLTDKYGKRFANEYLQATSRHDFYHELSVYDSEKAEYPRVPCYWFFDSRRFGSAPVVSGSAAAGPMKYAWSKDSKDEIARGWVKTAKSLEELVAQTAIVDKEQAVRTLNDYNAGCVSGHDAFRRPQISLVPLDAAPFYCMELWPGGPNTSGGPVRNEHAQVIDVFGQPIPGLYEAGELGEAFTIYPSNGANLSDAMCFGRIAASHALGLSGSLRGRKLQEA